LARLLILAFLALPLIEIAVMIKVGQSIGLWPTLGLLVGAGLLGAMLLRAQGLAVLARMRSNVQERHMPAQSVADAMMIGLAALFLVLPGFLSDIVALALLLPPVRGAIYGWLARRVVVVTPGQSGPGGYPGGARDRRVDGPDTIDLDADDYRRD
jgi:UPF0716 protein FxsA